MMKSINKKSNEHLEHVLRLNALSLSLCSGQIGINDSRRVTSWFPSHRRHWFPLEQVDCQQNSLCRRRRVIAACSACWWHHDPHPGRSAQRSEVGREVRSWAWGQRSSMRSELEREFRGRAWGQSSGVRSEVEHEVWSRGWGQGSRFFIICHIHNHTGYNQ